MAMSEIKAVIFDIDGTLTPNNSWTAFTKDLGASVDNHLEIYQSHRNGQIGLKESKDQLITMWHATGNANKQYIESMYEKWPIQQEAEEVVDGLKASGFIICLITGSVDLYASHISKRLGVANYYANAALHFDTKNDLVSFDYTLDQAVVKLRQLTEFCKKNGLKLDECVAIGDSDNDIMLFEQTGHGILIENDGASPELRQAAWRTVESLSQVKDLLR